MLLSGSNHVDRDTMHGLDGCWVNSIALLLPLFDA